MANGKWQTAILFISLLSLNKIYGQQIVTLTDFISQKHRELEKQELILTIADLKLTQFKKEFLPEVNLSTNIPGYSRSITSVLQPDGNYAFRESNTANSSIRLNISQVLPWTGGKFSISNSLNRLDVFQNNDNTTSFSSSWLTFNLTQPISFYNSFRGKKKLANLENELAHLNFERNSIIIRNQATKDFFDLVKIKRSTELTQKRLISNEQVAKKINLLVKNGRSGKLDSANIQLKLLFLKNDLMIHKNDFHKKIKQIESRIETQKLWIKSDDILVLPKDLPELPPVEQLVAKAENLIRKHKNLQMLYSKELVSELKASKHFSASLTGGFGFNNSTDSYDDLFYHPNQRQNISLSVSVPILDFNKKNNEIAIAEKNLEIQKMELKDQLHMVSQEIQNVYSDILNMKAVLTLQEQRSALLKVELNHATALLELKRISLLDYEELELTFKQASLEELEILSSIYMAWGKLKELTLTY